MSTARKLVTPFPAVPPQHERAIFTVYQNEYGRWCARTQDGMTAGTFFDRAAALRFARQEGFGFPVLILPVAAGGAASAS
jgi:hypothetical protein